MKFRLLILLLTAAPVVQAEPVTLDKAGRDMLAHAPSLQAAEAARNASAEDENLGLAALLPYLAASGSWMRQHQNTTFDQPIAFPLVTNLNMNASSYTLHAVQPLFDVERWALYRQGEASAAMGEASLRLARGQNMLMVATAWLNVMRSHARFNAAKAGEEAMTRVAEQASASFKVGLEPVNTSLVAISRRDLATAERITAEQSLDQARRVLSSLLGYEADVTVTPSPTITPMPLPAESEKAWLANSDHSDQVAVAERGVDLAESSYLKSIGSALPKVQLMAGWERQQSSKGTFGSGSTVSSSYVGVQVNVPLFAGGSLWAQRRKSLEEQAKAGADLAEAKRTARLAIRQSWLDWQASRSRLTAMKAAMTSAATEQKAAASGFEVGLRSITEVLDAEERLATAKVGYIDAVASHAMAVLMLYEASGSLDLDRLAHVQGWLTSTSLPLVEDIELH